MSTDQAPPQTGALDMARTLMRQVEQFSAAASTDPDAQLQAHIQGWGQRQHQAAEMAAQMALVSIAEDLREIRGLLDNTAVYDTLRAADSIAADIRAITQMLTRGEQAADWATREHMRRWGSGTETHEGEASDDQ